MNTLEKTSTEMSVRAESRTIEIENLLFIPKMRIIPTFS